VKSKQTSAKLAERLAEKSAEPRRPDHGKPRTSTPRQDDLGKAGEPPADAVELASMDSFPCSDPPGYYPAHC
jgi:hypothetical protein